MAKTPISTALQIAKAINIQYKTHIVINTSQFFGGEGKLVRMYVVKDAFYYGGKSEYRDRELFKTASGIYACLFMRDLLYAFQGKEIPEEDNEGYNNVKEKRNAEASIKYMKEAYLGYDEFETGD